MEIRGRNNLVVADLCNMFVNHKLLKVSIQNKTGKIHGSKWSSACRPYTRRHRCTSVYMKPPEEWHLLFILIFDSVITPTIIILTIIIRDLWVQWWRLHWILTQSKHNKHHNYHDLETRAVELIGGNWWCINANHLDRHYNHLKATMTLIFLQTWAGEHSSISKSRHSGSGSWSQTWIKKTLITRSVWRS